MAPERRARSLANAIPTAAVSSGSGKSYELVSQDSERWRDEQEITVRCLLCPDWSFTGTTAVARDQSAAHRAGEHPDALSSRQVEREARVRVAERRARDLTPRVKRVSAGRARFRWTHSQALEVLRSYVLSHGRPPRYDDACSANGFPSHPVQERLFGSFGEYIAAGGFPRPRRGRPRLPVAA